MYSSTTTYLGKQISKSPSNKTCHCLSDKRLFVKSVVVGSPPRHSPTTNHCGITEERALQSCCVLSGLRKSRLLERRTGFDTESAGREKGRNEEKGEKLHAGDPKRGWGDLLTCVSKQFEHFRWCRQPRLRSFEVVSRCCHRRYNPKIPQPRAGL